MSTSVNTEPLIRFTPNSLSIQGEPVILMSASLFYFRIPHQLWRERMEQVKACGYNSIDVYFPWNYHELQEGSWDFEGQRDAAAFLQLAQEAGLWVIARPGPYICSEWDGGALPAYLLAKDDVKLRQNDPAYLQHVARWYDQILPILKRYEVSSGGTVICVQLDNELDFYDCLDPAGYIGALRDQALAHGITVPLVACAGQGGLEEASGLADNVIPTCNFYPNDRDPEFEQKVAHFRERLASLGYPLLVTETNRSHYLLRRLLSGGAKLLGPYLQVSGTDFGFTNATNNWGKPLAFMTSDYDFSGMISPEGHMREEACEGRLLRSIIRSYGSAIAEASAVSETGWELQSEGRLPVFGPHELQLEGGGSLLFLTNGSDEEQHVQVGQPEETNEAARIQAAVPAGRSIILPVQVPLTLWGIEGKLVKSSAELYDAAANETGAALAFHSGSAFEVTLVLGQVAAVDTDRAAASIEDDCVRVTLDPTEAQDSRVTITLLNGQQLLLIGTSLMKALHLGGAHDTGSIVIQSSNPDEAMTLEQWELTAFNGAVSMNVVIPTGEALGAARADYLERSGVYRGFAWYEGTVPAGSQPAEGLLIQSGSDVVSLYADGRYAGTFTPGGGSRYVPLRSTETVQQLTARVEIWGHSNFDDARLPGLRLHALKGIQGLTAVTNKVNVTSNWKFKRLRASGMDTDFGSLQGDHVWPVVSFGGWLSPDQPAYEVYRRSYSASATASSFIVHFDGLEACGKLFVNGQPAGTIDVFDSYIDISDLVQPGEPTELTVYLERPLGRSAGRVWVYEGTAATNWHITSAEEEGLLAHASSVQSAAAAAAFPISLHGGEAAWLFGTVGNSEGGKGWRVRVSGAGLKLTVLFGDTIVGRLWLPGGEARPVLTGGDPGSFYLPGPWFGSGAGQLSILLEAVDQDAQGQLDSITFLPV